MHINIQEDIMEKKLIVIFFSLILTSIYSVTLNVPGTYSTIQAGINAAVDGDIVQVAAGTYIEYINFNGKNITVKTVEGATIKGNSVYDALSLVTFSGNENNAKLSGFHLTDSYGIDYGGAIYCNNSSPTITDVQISDVYSNWGALYCSNSNPTLTNVIINNNTAAFGSAMNCNNSSPTLTNVTIAQNYASAGSAVNSSNSSHPILLNCILWNPSIGEISLSGGSLTATYSDIQGGWSGTGNIDQGPIFCNHTSFDLGDVSPCVGTGLGGVDMGAKGVGCIYARADDQEILTTENSDVDITLTGEMGDGITLSFQVQSQPTHGALSGSEPNLTYTPDLSFAGTDSFTYTSNDGVTNSIPATVDIVVASSERNSLEFDGNSGGVDCGNDSSLDATDALSICSWIKIDPSQPDSWPRIVDKSPNYGFYYSSTLNKMAFFCNIAGEYFDQPFNGTIPFDTWIHTAVVWNGDDFKFYIDGHLEDTIDTTDGTLDLTTNSLFIGDNPENSRTFNGNIYEVRVWTSVLNETEIDDNMWSNLTGDETELAGFWRINEGVGNIVFDHSDNANNGYTDDASWSLDVPNSAPTVEDFDLETDEDVTVGFSLLGDDANGDDITYSFTTQPSNGTISLPPAVDGYSLQFDGSADYVEVPHHSGLNLQNEFTLEAWVKINNDTGTHRICSKQGSFGFGIMDGEIKFTTYGHLDYTTTSATLPSNEWCHLALTLNSSNDADFYVNGSFLETVSGSNSANTSSEPFYIGKGSGEHWNGYIDEVCVWNRVLTEQEISDGMENEHTGNETGLAGLWQFNEGSGTAADDGSSNNNNGTISGAEWMADEPFESENEFMYVYIPDDDYFGSDSFEYRANDGLLNSEIAVVDVTVNPINDPPVTSNSSEAMVEDTTIDIELTGTDVENDELTFTVETVPSHGSFIDEIYTPNENWNGTDYIYFSANDGVDDSNISMITITVHPVNDPPTFTSAPLEEASAGEEYIYAIITDDVDGDDVTIDAITYPDWLEFNEYAFVLSGTPTEEDVLVNNAVILVADDDNEGFAGQAFNIVIDAELYQHSIDLPESLTFAEDGFLETDLSAYISNPGSDPLSYFVSGEEHINAEIDTGIVNFTADTDWFGSEMLLISVVSDSRLIVSDSVLVIVQAQNDAPTIEIPDLHFAEDGYISLDVSGFIGDVDGDNLALSATGNSEIEVTIDELTVTLTSPENWFGAETITFSVNDGVGTRDITTDDVLVTVTSVNDAPTASAGDDAGGDEHTEIFLSGSGSDVENDELTYLWTAPDGITINETLQNPSFTAPEVDEDTEYTFSLIVNDGTEDSEPDEVIITVLNSVGQLSAPENVRIDVALTGAVIESTISWDAVNGATFYRVYSSDDPASLDWGTPIYEGAETTFTGEDTSSKMFYRVTASSGRFSGLGDNLKHSK